MVFFTVAMWPVLQSEGVSHATADNRGEVNGYFSAVNNLTTIIAPIIGAWMIQGAISPMWMASIFSLIALIVFATKRKSF